MSESPPTQPTPAAPPPEPPKDHKTQITLAKFGLAGTIFTTLVAAVIQVAVPRHDASTAAPVVSAAPGAENESIRAVRENLRRSQDALSDLRAGGLTDEHPRVIAARRRVELLQLELAQQITATRAP